MYDSTFDAKMPSAIPAQEPPPRARMPAQSRAKHLLPPCSSAMRIPSSRRRLLTYRMPSEDSSHGEHGAEHPQHSQRHGRHAAANNAELISSFHVPESAAGRRPAVQFLLQPTCNLSRIASRADQQPCAAILCCRNEKNIAGF